MAERRQTVRSKHVKVNGTDVVANACKIIVGMNISDEKNAGLVKMRDCARFTEDDRLGFVSDGFYGEKTDVKYCGRKEDLEQRRNRCTM